MRIVHCKVEKYDVYIGRPGKWGNPFSWKEGTLAKFKCDTREESIEKFREWIQQDRILMEDLHELDGKVLGCWCRPKSCHGDVLKELREQQIRNQSHQDR